MDAIKQYEIIRYKNGETKRFADNVVIEYSLTVYLNGTEFITMLCTPKSLKSLVIGFLYSEGVIESIKDIKDITIYEEDGYVNVELSDDKDFAFIGDRLTEKRTITTACGKGKTIFYNVINESHKIDDPITIYPDKILSLCKEFGKKSDIFLETGGVHSCALCTQNEIIIFEEDIGRHNALEKILGIALIDNINLKDKIVLTTGRISSEIIKKVAKRNIPVLISRSAPTDVAIDVAKKLNITLIGFARGQRMNIYTEYTYTEEV